MRPTDLVVGDTFIVNEACDSAEKADAWHVISTKVSVVKLPTREVPISVELTVERVGYEYEGQRPMVVAPWVELTRVNA